MPLRRLASALKKRVFVPLKMALRHDVVTIKPFRKASTTLGGITADYFSHLNDVIHGGMLRGEINRDRSAHGELNFLSAVTKDGMKILDIGANIGTVCVTLSKRTPNGKIIAFEPDTLNFGTLIVNLELNGVRNVIPFNLAAGSQDGFIHMYRSERNFGDHRSARPADEDAVHGSFTRSPTPIMRVNPSRFLHEALGDDCPKTFDLIKIDTQGADFDILASLLPFCRDGTIVSIEFSPYHLNNFGNTWNDVQDCLSKFRKIERVLPEGANGLTESISVDELHDLYVNGSKQYTGYKDLALYY